MTANFLADELDLRRNLLTGKEHELGARAILLYGYSADILRQQQSEIEALKKELALQRLSDIGQAIEEDRESAIYATGYCNGIAECKKQYELYGAVWHDEHGYQFTATVGEKLLNDDRWIKLYRKASEK